MKTKYFAIFIACAVSVAFLSCSKAKTSTTGGGSNNNPNSISISGMAFPLKTTVKVGSTVTWTNNDQVAHTVTSDDGVSFSSGSIDNGMSFSYKANTVGSFPYHCNFHSNMKATLEVIQ
jgi:plastocyanin